MSNAGADAGERIVVLIEPRHPSAAALAAVAAIADNRHGSVHGVLIEDANVRRLGALADVREVTLAGAQIRVPEAAALDLQLQADARHTRRMFEDAASRFSFAATFEVRQTSAAGELMRAAAGARLLVVGRAHAPIARAWWDTELAQLMAADVGDLAFVPADAIEGVGVVAFASDAPNVDGIARLAQRIATRTRLGLLRLRHAGIGALRAPSGHGLGPAAGGIRYLVVGRRAVPPATLRELLFSLRCTVVVAR